MKEMLVTWDILRNANFSPIFFLQGDYGIGSLKVVLRNLKDFQGNIRAIFCSSNNPTEPYSIEKEVDSTISTNVDISIPNEILQSFGKVYCRLILRSSDRGKIVGSVQEVYFHVVERKDWEFIEPLLPSQEKEYVKDVVDELYEILKNSKQELITQKEILLKNLIEFIDNNKRELTSFLEDYRNNLVKMLDNELKLLKEQSILEINNFTQKMKKDLEAEKITREEAIIIINKYKKEKGVI